MLVFLPCIVIMAYPFKIYILSFHEIEVKSKLRHLLFQNNKGEILKTVFRHIFLACFERWCFHPLRTQPLLVLSLLIIHKYLQSFALCRSWMVFILWVSAL